MSTGKNEHGISLFPEVERQPSIARQTMSAGAAAGNFETLTCTYVVTQSPLRHCYIMPHE